LEGERQQLIAKPGVKSLAEQILLINMINNITGCIARQLGELMSICLHIQLPLLLISMTVLGI
jgi:hypothetical protein